jgi:hypothetical protein
MVKGNNYAHIGENPERGASGNKKTAREGRLLCQAQGWRIKRAVRA